MPLANSERRPKVSHGRKARRVWRRRRLRVATGRRLIAALRAGVKDPRVADTNKKLFRAPDRKSAPVRPKEALPQGQKHKMAALVATPQQDTPLGGENYVVVTIEEVELSLNAVVALPSDD